jgi:lactoylglutathione lyase
MSRRYVHTCLRVRDPEASVRFYGALGFEPRGRLNFSSAYNLYLGLPGDGDVLELTVNRGQELPLIAFVADPDGYRIELIDGGEFSTPQDPGD